jgi:hypothetical protein
VFQPIQRFASALGTVIPSDAWRPSAGWVDRELEAAFKTRFNASALSDPVPPHLEWMLAAGEPCYAQLLGSPALGAPGVDVTLHVIPAGCVSLPWLRPTGSKVLVKALLGEAEVVQLLGDPYGRNPMRTATRLRVTSSGVTTYAGGPPRLLGEASLVQPVVLLEFAVHSREPMMGAKIKGYLRDAVGCVLVVFLLATSCAVSPISKNSVPRTWRPWAGSGMLKARCAAGTKASPAGCALERDRRRLPGCYCHQMLQRCSIWCRRQRMRAGQRREKRTKHGRVEAESMSRCCVVRLGGSAPRSKQSCVVLFSPGASRLELSMTSASNMCALRPAPHQPLLSRLFCPVDSLDRVSIAGAWFIALRPTGVRKNSYCPYHLPGTTQHRPAAMF